MPLIPPIPIERRSISRLISFCLCLGFIASAAIGADPGISPNPESGAQFAARLKRGQIYYAANCSMCHQMNGHGSGTVYPPLANSDYLKEHRREAILAIVQGLSGRITINGQAYDNQMPAVLLSDSNTADVLTYVYNSWGNSGGEFTADEVQRVRSTSSFKTYDDLLKANSFAPLPKPPQGFALREIVRLPDFGVRIASDGKGEKLYVLGSAGHVWRVDIASKQITNVFRADDYLDASRGSPSTLGMTMDSKGRLWITSNQRNDQTQPLVTNEVTIFRTTGTSAKGDPIRPKPWFQTTYPWGIGPYNHGVGHLAFGRDEKLYVSSGSRTDGGEKGTDPRLGTMGEVNQTALLWRFDPESNAPEPEVVARGIRNAWSFAWDGNGNLFTVSNGPDADAGEEMDWIRPDLHRHHGFPYQFENWQVGRKAYPHTPEPPVSTSFVNALANFGPDGKAGDAPGYTFNPHSSPAGLIWLDGNWPESVRNGFLLGRYGNLLKAVNDIDVGFDVLSVRLEKTADDSTFQVRCHTLLAPLGRPIDLHLAGNKKIYILEYTRPTNFKEQRGWLPGRILELSAQ